MNNLHIIKLEASNIKKLKAVSITPEGKVVIISGENDSGKTSTLDAIAYALGGKDMIDVVPIRQGASKARILVDLDEIKVTRTFSHLGGSQLMIEAKDGSPVRSPQTLLDSLCSKIAFDPLAFVRLSPDKQLETLRKLVGLDFAELDKKRKAAYEERTLANRELSSAKARASEVEVNPETPDKEVVVSELMAELKQLQDANKLNAANRSKLDQMRLALSEAKNDLERHRIRVAEMREKLQTEEADFARQAEELAQKETAVKEFEPQIQNLVDADESTVRQKINDASAVNAKVRDKQRYRVLQEEVKKAEKRSEDLTAEVENYDAQKRIQLAQAKFPLEGLSFDDTGVLLNGVPFTQGSQARQLQAAVAIGIAMNPKVRVILIRDGSLLDEKSLKMVAEMAEKNDMQIWIEIVQSNDPTAIVIEDGAIKPNDPSEKEVV